MSNEDRLATGRIFTSPPLFLNHRDRWWVDADGKRWINAAFLDAHFYMESAEYIRIELYSEPSEPIGSPTPENEERYGFLTGRLIDGGGMLNFWLDHAIQHLSPVYLGIEIEEPEDEKPEDEKPDRLFGWWDQ